MDPLSAITNAVSGASKLIDDAMNKIWPDPAQRASAEAITIKATTDAALAQVSQAMSVLLAEAKSEHWLAACWRPIVMLTFTALIVARWLGFAAPGLSEAEVLKLWDIVEFGLGGYVMGRSAEKIVPALTQALRK